MEIRRTIWISFPVFKKADDLREQIQQKPDLKPRSGFFMEIHTGGAVR